MLVCSFRDEFPSQQNGHFLMPEKKKYAQMLRILYQATDMAPVRIKVGHLDADLDNNREHTQWCVLCEPDITTEQFMYGVAAMLKNLDDREISESYTTLLFALQPNRPELVPSLEAFQHAEGMLIHL